MLPAISALLIQIFCDGQCLLEYVLHTRIEAQHQLHDRLFTQ